MRKLWFSWLLFIFSSFEFPATQKIKTLKVALKQYKANKYKREYSWYSGFVTGKRKNDF